MIIRAYAWRTIQVRQQVQFDLDLPDYIANNYAARNAAIGAYADGNQATMPWENDGGEAVIQRGYGLCAPDEDEAESE